MLTLADENDDAWCSGVLDEKQRLRYQAWLRAEQERRRGRHLSVSLSPVAVSALTKDVIGGGGHSGDVTSKRSRGEAGEEEKAMVQAASIVGGSDQDPAEVNATSRERGNTGGGGDLDDETAASDEEEMQQLNASDEEEDDVDDGSSLPPPVNCVPSRLLLSPNVNKEAAASSLLGQKSSGIPRADVIPQVAVLFVDVSGFTTLVGEGGGKN